VSVLRIVVRNGLSRDLARMLMDDLAKTVRKLATSPPSGAGQTKARSGFHH